MKFQPPKQIPQNPFALIDPIFKLANRHIQPHPLAMTLATADGTGKPSSRTVLLKHHDQDGFVFFTNSQSRKGRQLNVNPFASLTFYLRMLQVQIQVEGVVKPIAAGESDAYWATRPRQSQIGAWASAQSETIPDGDDFVSRYAKFEEQFNEEATIPRPPHWGGYRLNPDRIEFWFEGEYRWHQRWCYEKDIDIWLVSQLFP